jgi:hypothetical protein
MPDPSALSPETPIPSQAGLGWAAMLLGATCIPAAAYLGVQSLSVSLPVFGLWFFIPVVVLAIVLGMLGSRTAHGVAGAALGVAALLLCLSFVIVDRLYGAEIRSQNRIVAPSLPPGLNLDQLMKLRSAPGMNPSATTRPG